MNPHLVSALKSSEAFLVDVPLNVSSKSINAGQETLMSQNALQPKVDLGKMLEGKIDLGWLQGLVKPTTETKSSATTGFNDKIASKSNGFEMG